MLQSFTGLSGSSSNYLVATNVLGNPQEFVSDVRSSAFAELDNYVSVALIGLILLALFRGLTK